MFHLFLDQIKQCLQLGIVLRRNVRYHQAQQFQIFCVLFQLPLPRNIVHIGKVDSDFFTNREEVGVLVVVVKILVIRQLCQVENAISGLITVDSFNRVLNQLFDAVDRQPEGIHRAFQPLEKVDAHQAADAFLASLLGQACTLVVGHVQIFCKARRHDVVRRRIDRQIQRHEQCIDVIVVDGIAQVGQTGAQRDRRESLRELANVRSVVVFFNVLAGAGDGHAVQQLEEIKVQCPQQCIRCALLGGKFAPCIECLLRLTENFVDAFCCRQLLIDLFCVTFISKGKLVFQVNEFIVDRVAESISTFVRTPARTTLLSSFR